MTRYMSQESLKPFIDKHLRVDHLEPIVCLNKSIRINGYLATDLPLTEVCYNW